MSNINIVYFYSPKDQDLIKHAHLDTLKQLDGVNLFNGESDSLVGYEPVHETTNLIQSAQVIVLFYSVDFFTSEFRRKHLSQLVHQHKVLNKKIIAVLLRPYMIVGDIPDYEFEFFPSKEQALTDSSNID